jgi:hypothetical protein
MGARACARRHTHTHTRTHARTHARTHGHVHPHGRVNSPSPTQSPNSCPTHPPTNQEGGFVQAGDNRAALRVMALVLGDMRRATAFCAATAGQEAYMTLLAMLLHPGEGRDPLYTEACQLLAAQG